MKAKDLNSSSAKTKRNIKKVKCETFLNIFIDIVSHFKNYIHYQKIFILFFLVYTFIILLHIT